METITITRQEYERFRKLERMKALIEEDNELADDVIQDIEHSRKRSPKAFVSNEEMRKEFG
ncbi:hypothetical protein HZA96_05005 [Candidatus Woesearchaeota archaeon]|nr:hypothetical protein [Candidatus Woesearchaeota archaeon]